MCIITGGEERRDVEDVGKEYGLVKTRSRFNVLVLKIVIQTEQNQRLILFLIDGMMDLMVKYMLLFYAIVLSFVVLEVSSASVLFESALGPEGSIHLGPSLSLKALSNVVPSDAAAPVKSILEGSPPSPPLIQPIIPMIVQPIPQPGLATKSLAYPPTTSAPQPSITQVPPPSISQVPPSMPQSPPPSILPEPVASPYHIANGTTTFNLPGLGHAPKQLPATLNSGVYPDGPLVLIQSTKMRKYMYTEEVSRGSHDMPGHWLVTSAKLVMDDSKIGFYVIGFSSGV
nr:hypothetical protein [Tanacetum cinerariifolium]